MSVGIQNGNAYGEYVIQATLTPAAAAATSAAEQNFTVTGLRTTDIVSVCPPGHTAGVALASARVSAANTLSLVWVNPTAGGLTPPAGNYLIVVVRPESNAPRTSISD